MLCSHNDHAISNHQIRYKAAPIAATPHIGTAVIIATPPVDTAVVLLPAFVVHAPGPLQEIWPSFPAVDVAVDVALVWALVHAAGP
jgi:hypothetical protein